MSENAPIPLSVEQEQAAKDWAADDRLWTTQETVEFNLRTFARVILKSEPADSHSYQQGQRDLLERLKLKLGKVERFPVLRRQMLQPAMLLSDVLALVEAALKDIEKIS